MKRIFLATIAITTFTFAINAQVATEAPAKPATAKEEKAKMKAKQEEELSSALNELGLTATQSQQVKDALTQASQKSTDLKAKTGMDDAAKEAEKQKINQEKNAKLKEIMGKDKFSQWNQIRKKQKERAIPSQAPIPVTKPTPKPASSGN